MFLSNSSVAGRRFLHLQTQAEQLQEELYRAETSILTINALQP